MKLSIIIPVYNVESYIARCLESVLNQTYRDLEIILVNDCTPDNSMAIVADYAVRDARIKIINLEKNMGSMQARTVGIKLSTGDYIMFCDSDDWMPENAIQLLIDKILKTKADIVAGGYKRVNSAGKCLSVYKPSLPYGNDTRSVYKALLNHKFSHSLWGKIYRAPLLREYDFIVYDNFINSEDKLLMYQMVEFVKSVQVIDDFVYCYFVNENSSTMDRKKFASNKAINNIKIVSNYLVDKLQRDKELFRLLEQHLVILAINLARYYSISPFNFINDINLPDKENLFSLKKILYLFPVRSFFKIYVSLYMLKRNLK